MRSLFHLLSRHRAKGPHTASDISEPLQSPVVFKQRYHPTSLVASEAETPSTTPVTTKASKRARVKAFFKRVFRRHRRTSSVGATPSSSSRNLASFVASPSSGRYPNTRKPGPFVVYSYSRRPASTVTKHSLGASQPLKWQVLPGVSESTLCASFASSVVWTASTSPALSTSEFKHPVLLPLKPAKPGSSLVYAPYHDFFVRLCWLFETWHARNRTTGSVPTAAKLSFSFVLHSSKVSVVFIPSLWAVRAKRHIWRCEDLPESRKIELIEDDQVSEEQPVDDSKKSFPTSSLEAHLATRMPDDHSMRKADMMVLHLSELYRPPVPAKTRKVAFSDDHDVTFFSSSDCPAVLGHEPVSVSPRSCLRKPSTFPLHRADKIPHPVNVPGLIAEEFASLAEQCQNLNPQSAAYARSRDRCCLKFKQLFQRVCDGPLADLHGLLSSQTHAIASSRKNFAETNAAVRGIVVNGKRDQRIISTLRRCDELTAKHVEAMDADLSSNAADLSRLVTFMTELEDPLDDWYKWFYEHHCRKDYASNVDEEYQFHERIGFMRYAELCFMTDTDAKYWEETVRSNIGVLREAGRFNLESLRLLSL
ncbi:hypothetical protein FT663_04940 [Candidozyma haemuli var. vulneris]|uniref:Uncharacterized protein n=1 Tax=Candidozyma haemuli TaxID=45357 RepID=A0A2V1AZL9_9ASCO|nr:hypothetical protein CXQ85_003036 [[Candida] haemuloni]KAF3986325.1 hypothetical protein FT663_04940 [[Candida] haemuloni var. vulneris]KAF3986987.1 hypothetical protein FT662_04266 [[Candida] haemuloni var. vulneris]PVH23302.1 hypothetical protein CXQ85_003036 [[Candida] haemuloni]